MIGYDDVVELLTLQTKACDLLMWLGRECVHDPALLSAEAAADLAHPTTAAAWVDQHRSELPADLVVPNPHGSFANLLSSFFATSFRVEHLEFDNRLVSARIVLGISENAPDRAGLRRTQALALKHLAASQRLPMAERQANKLVRARTDLRDALLVWTYIWELDRRARNKGKGPVVHRIWRSISWGTKRALTADRVWSSRQQLLDAVREFLHDAPPEKQPANKVKSADRRWWSPCRVAGRAQSAAVRAVAWWKGGGAGRIRTDVLRHEVAARRPLRYSLPIAA